MFPTLKTQRRQLTSVITVTVDSLVEYTNKIFCDKLVFDEDGYDFNSLIVNCTDISAIKPIYWDEDTRFSLHTFCYENYLVSPRKLVEFLVLEEFLPPGNLYRCLIVYNCL